MNWRDTSGTLCRVGNVGDFATEIDDISGVFTSATPRDAGDEYTLRSTSRPWLT